MPRARLNAKETSLFCYFSLHSRMELVLEALRVVRQRAPLLPLALCKALEEPRDVWAAVNVENVELCIALSIDPHRVYSIALLYDNVELLSWALDNGIPKRDLGSKLVCAGLATMTLLLKRNP